VVSLIRRKTDRPPGRFLRQDVQTGRQVRALRASATSMDLARLDRGQAYQLMAVRQAWQTRAWGYRREVGELRYAVGFLGNAARRMMFFPAVYMPGALIPVPIEDSDLKQHTAIAHDALDRIGDVGGRAALAKDQMENFEVTGECYLISRIDDSDGVKREVWEVRSQSEVQSSEDGKILIRDMPGAQSGSALWSSRDSSTYVMQPDDFFARMWWPDPEWRRLADSPIRSAESILEELIILGKDVRASGVSRLANNGILLMPDSLSVVSNDPGEGVDPEDDEFVNQLMEAAAEAIRDPGSAAAAIPIVARGPAEALDKVKFLTLPRPEADNSNKRSEVLRRLATSIDLPVEIITGMADLNHWTAWQVDDSTFRHHIEPLVQGDVDAWTAAYYRRYLIAAGVPPEAVSRMVVWYDPTELLTKPDRSVDAKDAHERFVLSDESLRTHLGFTKEEAPTDVELARRLLMKSNTLDPDLAKQLLMQLDPSLKEPEPKPVVVSPFPPGGGDGGDTGQPDDAADPNGPTPAETGPPEGAAAAGMRRRVAELHQKRADAGHPAEMRARLAELRAAQQQEIADLQALLAASTRTSPDWAFELSQRMAERDQLLRETLRVACEAAVRRTLEKAGAKVITRARQRDAVVAASLREIPAWAVPGRLGPALVAALGLNEDELLKDELTDLRRTWDQYVRTGQTQALRDAARLVGMDINTAFTQLDGTFRSDRDKGWAFLRQALDRNTRSALVADPTRKVETAQLVPTSSVRAAIAVAGGFQTSTSQGFDPDTMLPVDPTEHFGQIGTGTTVKGFLEKNGATVEKYRWVHGLSIHEFLPHAALDGHEFDDWSDARLADTTTATMAHGSKQQATGRFNAGLSYDQIDPAAITATMKSGGWAGARSDQGLLALLEKAGVDKPGTLVSQEEFDKLDWPKTYRGLKENDGSPEEAAGKVKQYADDWKTGPFYPGTGMYGNGAYSAANREVAEKYAEGTRGELLQIAIRPEAKMIDVNKLMGMLDKEFAGRTDDPLFALFDKDPSKYAVAKGYDIMTKDRSGSAEGLFYIILNRGATVTVR
jgi:hypothetical protein